MIFTPAEYGVGGSSKGDSSILKKITWEHSFKWKPPEFNTIDFLVVTKKGNNNQDEVGNLFQKGEDMYEANGVIIQNKTLEIKHGFETQKHLYINHSHDIKNENIT